MLKHKLLFFLPLLSSITSVMAEDLPEIDCLIEPNTVVKIGTREEGVIESIAVERGDFVEQGQVLARLESDVEQATLELARAASVMTADIKAKQVSVGFNRRSKARQHELYLKKVIAKHQMDTAQTETQLALWELHKARDNKRLAELEMNRAQAALNRRVIHSPIRGVVTERLLSVGEVADLQPLLSVAQLDPLKVEVIAPISLYGLIEHGMAAVIRPEAPIGGEYQATVKLIDPVMDAASGTFGVRLELPNPDYQLPGGLRCKIVFQAPSVEPDKKTVGHTLKEAPTARLMGTQTLPQVAAKHQ